MLDKNFDLDKTKLASNNDDVIDVINTEAKEDSLLFIDDTLIEKHGKAIEDYKDNHKVKLIETSSILIVVEKVKEQNLHYTINVSLVVVD